MTISQGGFRTFITIAILFNALTVALSAQNSGAPSPPGNLVDVGGYRVHLYCTGKEAPTVLIVGGFSFDWALVQPEIAKFARVCTYDVAGTAWSDAGPSAKCLDRVDELHRLIVSAKIQRPFVFVGFSIGALVGRRYASLYPNDLAGMVMVDHAFLPEGDSHSALKAGRTAAPRGDSPPVLIEQSPIVLSTEETSNFQQLPDHVRALQQWAESRKPIPDTAETAKDCASELGSLKPAVHPLGGMPLVVISTGNTAPGYRELQQRLLLLSTNSRQVMAERSFHSVEIDQPEVVVGAVRQVVEAVRGERRLQ